MRKPVVTYREIVDEGFRWHIDADGKVWIENPEEWISRSILSVEDIRTHMIQVHNGKVMVFTNDRGSEWYCRDGVVTVRNSREIEDDAPERPSIINHAGLFLRAHCKNYTFANFRFKELRNE